MLPPYYKINIFLYYFAEAHAQPKLCPSGWMHLVSSCYYFSKDKTTWSQAKSGCQKVGGYLAVPMNAKENSALWNIVKQKNYQNSWIGLTRHDKDNKFYTTKGKKPSYTNWSPGEPNSNSERCAHMWSHRDGTWNDAGCHNQFHFICHQPVVNIRK
jgi:hypothetical protein